jgi:Fe2+ or Zn2+ uptake regulation protein
MPDVLPMPDSPLPPHVAKLIRARGLRMTVLRSKIANLISSQPLPLSAKSIRNAIGCDLTSVYRTLYRLQDAGLVNVTPHSKNNALFYWACQDERVFPIMDRATDRVVHMDPKIAAFVTRTLEVIEQKLSENGYCSVRGYASFRARVRPQSFAAIAQSPLSIANPAESRAATREAALA